jgi:hypothetical protein
VLLVADAEGVDGVAIGVDELETGAVAGAELRRNLE